MLEWLPTYMMCGLLCFVSQENDSWKAAMYACFCSRMEVDRVTTVVQEFFQNCMHAYMMTYSQVFTPSLCFSGTASGRPLAH
jgi:hypothetical protein